MDKFVAGELSRKPKLSRFAAHTMQFAERTVQVVEDPKIDAFAARTLMYAARTEGNNSSRREDSARGANCSEQSCSRRELG